MGGLGGSAACGMIPPMRLRSSFALAILTPLALSHAGPVRAETPLPAWLAGTWAMEAGAVWADGVWTTARGGAMLGIGRTGFGPDLESWEMLRIERKGGGGLAYIVQSRGGAPVEFPLAVASANAMEFANPANSFPQRIRLWREGQLLMREVSRMDGSEAVRFNYRPVDTRPAD